MEVYTHDAQTGRCSSICGLAPGCYQVSFIVQERYPVTATLSRMQTP